MYADPPATDPALIPHKAEASPAGDSWQITPFAQWPRRSQFWTLFGVAWLLMALWPVAATIAHPSSPREEAIALGSIAAFAAAYSWYWFRGMCLTGARRRLPPALGLAVLALLLPLAFGPAWLGMAFYAPILLATSTRARTALGTIALLSLIVAALFVGAGGVDLASAASVALEYNLLGGACIGTTSLIETNRQLREARIELARLAVAEERARFARDLHDLLGHSLSVIALKSELAGRLMESQPARAAAEISDIERVARQSLKEVREAVSGIRQSSLTGEIEAARDALVAAGIDCTLERSEQSLTPAAETILAWAIREGTTNVMRHSRARRCQIRLQTVGGRASVDVEDDGAGPPIYTPNGNGNGLKGLAERVTACNGELETGPLAGARGYRLHVSVPMETE